MEDLEEPVGLSHLPETVEDDNLVEGEGEAPPPPPPPPPPPVKPNSSSPLVRKQRRPRPFDETILESASANSKGNEIK